MHGGVVVWARRFDDSGVGADTKPRVDVLFEAPLQFVGMHLGPGIDVLAEPFPGYDFEGVHNFRGLSSLEGLAVGARVNVVAELLPGVIPLFAGFPEADFRVGSQ